MGKNQKSVVVLWIWLKFWCMIPMGVKYNHTKFEQKTQRWRPGTGFAGGGPQFQKLQFRAKTYTNPTARALACCRGGMWVPGGGASCLGVGRPGSGALSHPRLPPLWAGCRGPLPTGCGPGWMRAWGPVTNPTARNLASWLCALRGRHEGARGGRLLPRSRASGVRRSLIPDCPASRRAAGAHFPLAVDAGGCGRGGPLGGLPGPTTNRLWVRGATGVGTRHQTHSALSCVLWGRHEGARGGRLLPGCGASGFRRSPSPDCPPSGRAAGAHYPLAVGAERLRAWGPVTNPTARALACCGGGMRVPGGGTSCLGVGRPGWGALPSPTARPLGGLPGPTTHWLWVRGGAGVGTRHQPHSARSCVLALRAVGAAQGRPGGAPPAWCGASGVGRSPRPDCPPSGRDAGAYYPLAVGAGGGGRGDPSPTPQRALLRAVGAACGCPGGAPLAWVWGVRGRALSHPRLPALWAGCRGPLPTGSGRGGMRAWGPVTNATARTLASWLCALRGGHEGAHGGRLPPRSGALPPPTARPLGGLPGPTSHWLWMRGDAGVGALWAGCRGPLPTGCWCGGAAGVGTRHQPHSALSCVLWRRHEGVRGGRLLPGCGASGFGRSHTPDCPPSGRAAGAHYPLAVGAGGVRAWGPVTNPTARALASWLCALWGRHEGARGGRLLPGCRASGVGRSPSPDCPPSGQAAGAHYPLAVGAGGVRAWGPGTNPTARTLASWLCALWGRHEGARGGRLLHGCGASGTGRSPTPDCPPSGRAAGAHYPLAVGAGGVRAWGPITNPTARALASWLCALWGRHEGARGGRLLPGVGRPGSGALPPPTARPLGGMPGPNTHWLWVRGGAGVGTRHQPHSARSCVLWGRHEGARGGRLLPGCGASGVQRFPTPDCPPSGRAAGAHYPLALGAGGCGRGDPSPTPQRALLRAGFARCGGGTRAPAGGASHLGLALSHPRLPAL